MLIHSDDGGQSYLVSSSHSFSSEIIVLVFPEYCDYHIAIILYGI